MKNEKKIPFVDRMFSELGLGRSKKKKQQIKTKGPWTTTLT